MNLKNLHFLRRFSSPLQRVDSLGSLAAAIALSVSSAVAQTWTGNVSGNWNEPLNWNSAVTSASNLIWNVTSTSNLVSNNDYSSLSVSRMNFDGAPAGIVINGNQISLTSAGNTAAINGGNATINAAINLTSSTTARIGSTAGYDFVINGFLSAPSASGLELAHAAGTLALNAANTFTGSVIIGNATVTGATANLLVNTLANSGVAQSAGTGNLIQFGGGDVGTASLVYVGSSAASTNKSFQIGVASTGTSSGGVFNNGLGAITWNGTQSLVAATNTNARAFFLGGFNSESNTWAGSIQNNNNTTGIVGLTKQGTGQWVLTGNNTFTGALTVASGRLVIDYANGGDVAANNVTLLGGTLEVRGGSGDTLGTLTTTANTGMSSIDLNRGSGAGVALTFGASTIGANSTLFINQGNAANSIKVGSAVSATTAAAVRYILRDSTGRVDFASNNNNAANNLTQVNATTPLASAPVANENYSLNGASATVTGSALATSLRIDASAAGQSLTLNQTTTAANTQIRGIMVVGNNDFTITQAGGQAGSLGNSNTATAGALIYHYGAGVLTLDTRLAGNSTSGTGTVEFYGTGLINWTKAANSSGTVLVDGVRLRQTSATGQLLSNANTGLGSGNVILANGGIWEISGGGTITRSVAGNGTAGAITWNGDGGFGAVGSNATVNLGTAVTWGTTTGFVGANNALILSSSTSNATVDFQSALNLGGQQRLVRVNNGAAAVDAVFSGVLSGGLSAGIVKQGEGTLALTNSNTFAGRTTVSAGTLVAGAANALGATTSIIVEAPATLQITASNSVNNAASVTLAGGTISRGSGVSETLGALTLTANSALNFGTGTAGNFTFASFAPGSFKLSLQNFTQGNTLTFTSGTYDAANFNSFAGSVSSFGGGFTITAVPEPTAVLAGVAFFGLLAWRERKGIRRMVKLLKR